MLGRNTQGVRLIRLDEGERLTGVERVEPEAGEAADGDGMAVAGRPAPRTPPTLTGEPTRLRAAGLTSRPAAVTLHLQHRSGGPTAMSRVFNFSAGPAALPLEVLEQAARRDDSTGTAAACR